MNILIVNWTWYPSGGDWTTVENSIRLYEKNGFKVIPFSMQDERNFPTEYENYFVSKIDYKELNKRKTPVNYIRVLNRSIYSIEAKNNLKKLLNSVKIDIAHLHNYGLYLTPSILPVLKEQNIPIVWTLHDYGLICPAVSFVSNGNICEACKGGKFYNCTLKKCKKNSYQASLVASIQSYFYNIWNIDKYINYYICPSEFLRQKFIEFGYNANKLIKIFNPYDIESLNINTDSYASSHINYILYVGRLELIKGVRTLIDAMKNIHNTKLIVIGDGTQADYFKTYVSDNHIDNIIFMGQLKKEEVIQFIKNSKFAICPSECYENLPYSIVEAMIMGKPVIGARIGGIPELIIDGKTGLTFESGNVESLTEKINYLLGNPSEIISFGQNAKKYISELVNLDTHYKKLEYIFNRLKII